MHGTVQRNVIRGVKHLKLTRRQSRAKTTEPTETKLGSRHHVARVYIHAMLSFDHVTCGVPAVWWLVTVLWLFFPFFLSHAHIPNEAFDHHRNRWLKRRVSVKGCAFSTIESYNIGFGITVPKNRGLPHEWDFSSLSDPKDRMLKLLNYSISRSNSNFQGNFTVRGYTISGKWQNSTFTESKMVTAAILKIV
jgi:hypothetical protein